MASAFGSPVCPTVTKTVPKRQETQMTAQIATLRPESAQTSRSHCDLSTIRKDSEGRFCLNDLHKAAGGEKKHQPSDFLRLTSTCALIRELNETSWNSGEYVRAVQDQSGDSRSAVKTTVGGSAPGTYVVKELVYAYAMWVSPAFHLKVIRFFDRGVKDGVAVADNAAADLLANPLAFFEKVLAQAKVLQAERDRALEENRVLALENKELAPKAAALEVISGENGRSLAQFVRTLKGVNSLAVKKDLMHCGRLYKRTTGYRVRAAYKEFYLERFDGSGKAEIYVTARGMADLTTLYKAGKLTMCKGAK